MRLLYVVATCAVVAVVTAFVTKPEPMPHLVNFYRRVRPPGFWGPVAEAAGGPVDSEFGMATAMQMLLALVFVFAGMIGIGKVCLGEPLVGFGLIAISAITGFTVMRMVFKDPRLEVSSK